MSMDSNQSSNAAMELSQDDFGQDQYQDAIKEMILVIDDDPEQGEVISKIIEKNGFDTTYVSSYEEALRILRYLTIDVIVSDIMMPGINGLELVKALRSAKASPGSEQIPIILTTAGNGSLEYDSMAIGADMFCLKSFVPRVLMQQIRLLLARNNRRYED